MSDSPTQYLTPHPLTRAGFAAFGDVIECTAGQASDTMNDARFARYDALAGIDHDVDARGIISIAECRSASTLPYQVSLMERHPHGSQAFIPMAAFEFLVVVAPAGPAPDPTDLRAFITDGQQGISYHRGTWHMPLIALIPGQRFIVVDVEEHRPNCDEVTLNTPVWLERPGSKRD